jgi:hypothetical protein
MRYLIIEVKTLHQFCETLAAEAERCRSATAMAGGPRECRPHEPLLELEAGAFE